jgi:hypothetical protein
VRVLHPQANKVQACLLRRFVCSFVAGVVCRSLVGFAGFMGCHLPPAAKLALACTVIITV